MKIYMPGHLGGAGLHIYAGYLNAWKSLGFDPEWYIHSLPVEDCPQEYYVMTREDMLLSEQFKYREFLEGAKAAFVFTPGNYFPPPWGEHPNWVSNPPEKYVETLEGMDNVHLWTFGNSEGRNFYPRWEKEVHYIPLAFDHIGYQPEVSPGHEFDICFVGGWADNGFNEKEKIILDHYNEFKKLGIKLGFSIDQNISHQDEANVLFNSKIAVNLHDQYQRVVGTDSNERTFKSLGLTGFLICDKVKEVENLFPRVPTSDTPKKFAKLIKHYLNISDNAMDEFKKENRRDILDNHTYVNRVNSLLKL